MKLRVVATVLFAFLMFCNFAGIVAAFQQSDWTLLVGCGLSFLLCVFMIAAIANNGGERR